MHKHKDIFTFGDHPIHTHYWHVYIKYMYIEVTFTSVLLWETGC